MPFQDDSISSAHLPFVVPDVGGFLSQSALPSFADEAPACGFLIPDVGTFASSPAPSPASLPVAGAVLHEVSVVCVIPIVDESDNFLGLSGRSGSIPCVSLAPLESLEDAAVRAGLPFLPYRVDEKPSLLCVEPVDGGLVAVFAYPPAYSSSFGREAGSRLVTPGSPQGDPARQWVMSRIADMVAESSPDGW